MTIVKATDLRPGIQQAMLRTITSVTFAQDGQVHVEWSDGAKQVLSPEASIEVEDTSRA
jgi:membrane peptidoglycan carboxypeptidase